MYRFGSGMFLVNPFVYAGGAPAPSYLLDTYPATAAYSLRKLSSSATLAIRVRRSIDNAEQNIGFAGVDLDTAALTSFVGANSAFITTWYDQSGNGWDITQSNALRQPRIVNAGTIESLGSHSSINFADFYNLFNDSFTAILKPVTAFSVFSIPNTNYTTMFDGGGVNTFSWGTTNNYKTRILKSLVAEIAVSANAQTQNAQTLNGVFYGSSGNFAFFKNGETNGSGTNNITINASNKLVIGATYLDSAIFSGEMQEMLIWTSDQTANKSAIETDINTYYGIY